MNKGKYGAIPSKRTEKATKALEKDSRSLSASEKNAYDNNELEKVDGNLVLKTLITPGEELDLLSVQKNKDSRVGIIDFQDAQIINDGAGGSMIVDAIKFSHAAGLKADDVAAKSFIQKAWPADLENGYVLIKQDTAILHKAKLSDFAFKGDEPQTREAQYLRLARPFTLAAGKRITIKLLRPNGVVGADHFLAVEFKGMQLVNKRK